MKKLIAALSLILVACFAVVGLSACKKKKEDPMAKYVGTWATIREDRYSKTGELTWSHDLKPGENGYTEITLNADGTALISGYECIWKVSDNGIALLPADGEGAAMTFEYADGSLKDSYYDDFAQTTYVITYKKIA